MKLGRFASPVLLAAMLAAGAAAASAQVEYNWTKYNLVGYGGVDVGYNCDNGRLMVAVHGEAKGTVAVALGDDAAKSFDFDGTTVMGPDGYNGQGLLQKDTQCDNRATWPIISLTYNGTTLKIRWQ